MKKRCDCVRVVRVLCKGVKKGGSVLEFFVQRCGKKKNEWSVSEGSVRVERSFGKWKSVGVMCAWVELCDKEKKKKEGLIVSVGI